ncbi:MAG: hypothetical protein K0R39_3863 [Symbiobacteriaceae bacterium]|jgi:hypothetical protein|nr:hypothetical protein [Symbiobacteriaceae bacterium]
MSTPKIGPDTIIPERAPHLWVPLRFFLGGLLSLAALLITAYQKAPLLAHDYLHNAATLAVTHLFTLGLGGMVVMGALYQMVPVLLYSTLFSERLANIHLAVHGIGLTLMVTGFRRWNTILIATGGGLVLTGALLFACNLGLTFRKAERWNWHGAFMPVAVLFYIATLIWGFVLALNQRYGFIGEVEGAALTGHLTLGFLGWFSLMIVSAGLKLVPMFAPAKTLPPRLVAATGGGLAAGVLAILAGLWLGRPLLWAGYVLSAAALLTYTGLIGYTYLHRRTGPLDFSIRFSLTAAGCLVPPILALPWAPREWQAGLTFLFVLGFIGGTILGMLLRIIPFMVWLHRFRNREHKQEKVPFLHELFQPRFAWTALLTWFPAVLLISLGVALEQGLLITAGAIIGMIGLAAYGWALRQILHHVKPGTPALFPGRK